jgi:hypothetical protein
MKTLKIVFSLLFISLLSSCNLNDDQECYEITGTDIRSVAVEPFSTTTNVPIDIPVTYSVYKDCDSFYVFHKEIFEGVTFITANIRYDGCDCEVIEAGAERIESYRFVAPNPGTYILRFKTTNTTFIERAIIVTNE